MDPLPVKRPVLHLLQTGAQVALRPVLWPWRRPVDVSVWGHRLRLRPVGNLTETRLLFTPNWHDSQERAFLQHNLRRGDVFVDIGANIGAYSFWVFSLLGNDCQILAVEPDPELRSRFSFNCETNAATGVIELIPAALSDVEGEAELVLDHRNKGRNALSNTGASGDERVRVPLTTLHRLLKDRGLESIDALKIDVEGQELAILGHYFANTPQPSLPRVVLTEMKASGIYEELDRLLLAHGYRRRLSTALNAGYVR